MLQTLAGGAAARPFVTHSNALDADLYLRIAPELFLKRCVVGGFDKVFELNRVFRNEGADSTHSPEFAMLETYQAYGTYDDSAVVTRELIQEVADEAIGTRQAATARRHRLRHRRRMGVDTNVSVAVGSARRRDHPGDAGRSACGRSPIGSVSRFRATAATGTGNSSRNCGSTPSATSCGRRPSSRDFPVETTPLTRAAPQHRRRHREVGSLRPRIRTGDRILRIDRPGRAAREVRSAGPRRGRRRRRGDGARRGFSRRVGVCDAAVLPAPEWVSTGC